MHFYGRLEGCNITNFESAFFDNLSLIITLIYAHIHDFPPLLYVFLQMFFRQQFSDRFIPKKTIDAPFIKIFKIFNGRSNGICYLYNSQLHHTPNKGKFCISMRL